METTGSRFSGLLRGGDRQTGRLLVLMAVVAVMASGCLYLPYAQRNTAFQPQAKPWWCAPDAGVALSSSDCEALSIQFDVALNFANAHLHASDSAEDVVTPYQEGVGARFARSGPTGTFNPASPDVLLYTGTDPSSQLAGLEWNVIGATAPTGFVGTNDVWAQVSENTWRVRAWIVRPFQDHAAVFAPTHPCLGPTEPVYDTTAGCYTATHTRPLEVLVSNDDGYAAPGIDAVVEALRGLSGVHVTVAAPATNQSGTGDKTTPGGVTAFSGQTASGYPATAVNGYPADSVLYALNILGVNPDLVVSGINLGQNIGPVVALSGTVGAARTAARRGIPALAASSGVGTPTSDFPSAAAAVLTWVNDFRLGRAGPPYQVTANLNVPSCSAGSIRGVVDVPVATAINGRPILGASDCTSTATAPVDDIDGYLEGFTTLSDVGT